MAPRPRRSPTAPLLAFLALGVALLGAPLHLVLVRHAVCVAHGELVHVDADAPPAAACAREHGASPDGVRAPREERPDAWAPSPEEREAVHGACELVFPRFEALFAPRLPSVHVPAPPVALAPPRDQTLTRRSFPLYRLAPKQSPPV